VGARRNALIADLKMVQNSGFKRVGMLLSVYEEFKLIDVSWRAKFQNRFEQYGIKGGVMLGEHFASEGRHSTGGKPSHEIHLYAFKAHQHRLYGVVTGIDGFATFVGLKLITDKKKNVADQKLLARIVQDYARFID
jgi:hypothetical protein